MDIARRLLLFNLAVGFYNVGTVWLTQVTCYPLFAQVGPGEFPAYHLAWWHGIWGVILGPAIVGFLGAVAMLRWRPPHISIRAVWLAVGVLVAVYSLTAVWWGPLMGRLIHAVDPTGAATNEYRLLLTTHWLRVALITAYAVLIFRFVTVSFGTSEREPVPRAGALLRSVPPTPASSE